MREQPAPKRSWALIPVTVAACCLIPIRAHTSPPLLTDDAATLAPGECQLETEYRRFDRRNEFDIMPACNFIGDAELAVGTSSIRAKEGPHANRVTAGLKKVLIAGEGSAWSAGVSAATILATGKTSHPPQHAMTALFTRTIDVGTLHLNAGWASDRAADAGARKHRSTWGVAIERDVTSRWTLVGEAFGQRGLPETAQLGVRWWMVPKAVQLTASMATQRGLGREGRWASFGVRFESGGPLF